MSGVSDPYEFILSKLRRKRRCGKGVVTLCPAHDDNKFSLRVARGRSNNVVMKCYAGCSIDAICAGFGIAKSDLFSGVSKKRNSDWDIIAVYDYHNQNGQILYQHARYRNKQFTWRGPNGQGDWRYGLYAAWFEQWNDGDWRAVKDENKSILDDPGKKPHIDARWFDAITERVLYKEAQIRKAPPGSLVLYVEGEKDVENAIRMGVLATTAGSASDWRQEFAGHFAGCELVILPDNDPAGERLAQKVASDNYETSESIRITRLPGLAANGDLSDWLEARIAEGCNLEQAREQLLALIEETRLWEPELERDEFIDKAVQDAQRAINRAATEMNDEDSDPPLTEDKTKETSCVRLVGTRLASWI
jgi:putative DNA primase/helicase